MSRESVQVRVTRTYSATAERVFDAWLDPAMIGQFMFGPRLRDEKITHLNVGARVGGTFSFLVERQGQAVDHIGRYEVIERPTKLVFTWSIAPQAIDASRVTITIAAHDKGCELTLLHELAPGWEAYAERTKDGWTRMMDELAKVLNETFRSTRDIIVRTQDWERAKAFYGSVLGFVVASEDDALTGFETGAIRLYIEKGPSHGPVFELLVADVQAAKQKLVTAGCVVVEEDVSVPRCYMRDPFGLVFNVGHAG